MAALSRILAWRIPWTEEPCGVQSTACTGVCVGVFKRVHLCVHVCTQPALSFSATYGRQCCGGPPPGPGRASSREAAGTWTDRLQRDSPRREAGATFTNNIDQLPHMPSGFTNLFLSPIDLHIKILPLIHNGCTFISSVSSSVFCRLLFCFACFVIPACSL